MSNVVRGASRPHEVKEGEAVIIYRGQTYVALEFAHLRNIYTNSTGHLMFSEAVKFKGEDREAKEGDEMLPLSGLRSATATCINHGKVHSVLAIAKAYLCKKGMYREAKKYITDADSVPYRIVHNTKRNQEKFKRHKITQIDGDRICVEIFDKPVPKKVDTLVPTGKLFLAAEGNLAAGVPAQTGSGLFLRKSIIIEAVEAYARGIYSDWEYLLKVGTPKPNTLDADQEERKYPQHDPRLPEQTIDAIYYRSGGVCEGCGDETKLELHHLRYPGYGTETPKDLALFCRACHAAQHPEKQQLELRF